LNYKCSLIVSFPDGNTKTKLDTSFDFFTKEFVDVMLSQIDPKEPRGSRIIVTVIGPDRVGIIAGVAQVLASNKINILDISQTILQEFLVMIMVADMSGSTVDLLTLKDSLDKKGLDLGVRIEALHEDAFNFMHRI
jgi:ACT domain-containing protein